jgi:hypothetical protein
MKYLMLFESFKNNGTNKTESSDNKSDKNNVENSKKEQNPIKTDQEYKNYLFTKYAMILK